MTDDRLTALIAGASGLVGSACLDLLLASANYARVRVITRRDLGGQVAHPKIEQIVTDFAHLHAVGDHLRADHVFCSLGTTIKKAGSRDRFREVDFSYPEAIASHCLANGARHFSLVSSLGADTRSRFFYSRVKGELEQALQGMAWPSLAIFQPSVIAGDRTESRPLEHVAQRVLRFAPTSVRPVHARTIAEAMIAVAMHEPPGTTIVASRDIPDRAQRR